MEALLELVYARGYDAVTVEEVAAEAGGDAADAAYAHVRWIQANPKKMRFGLLETLWAGEMTSALRDNLFHSYIEMVDAGRGVAPDRDAVPVHTAEVPEMMYLAVHPYLSDEAARRELTIAPPERQEKANKL